MSCVWFGQLLRRPGLWAGLGLLLSLASGCHRESRLVGEANEPSAASSSSAVTPIDGQSLSRTDILLQLVRSSHAEVQNRLGPHRLESHTQWTITPLPGAGPQPPEVAPGFREGNPARPYEGAAAFESTPVTLDETRFISVDGLGNLQLSSLNDHGYGVEATLMHDYVYLRMRHGPYIRHRAEGDELERLRALGYEPGAAILEAVAPFVYLSTPSETSRLGRPAWQVTLSRQEASGKRSEAAKTSWRGGVQVEAIDGLVVVDRQRGALLELKLSVRFVAPRGKAPPGTPAAEGERVQVAAQHELRAVALGKDAIKIQAPTEWNEPPARSRPTLEKQELLNGLVPARP